MEKAVSRRECELCRDGLIEKIESLRREIRIGVVASITVTTILLTVFELLTLKMI